MTDRASLDPYLELLGIPAGPRPPNHYELLGLEVFEQDPERILRAAKMRLGGLQRLAFHPDPDRVRRVREMIKCVDRGSAILSNSGRRAAYDMQLSAQLGVGLPPAAALDGPKEEPALLHAPQGEAQRPPPAYAEGESPQASWSMTGLLGRTRRGKGGRTPNLGVAGLLLHRLPWQRPGVRTTAIAVLACAFAAGSLAGGVWVYRAIAGRANVGDARRALEGQVPRASAPRRVGNGQTVAGHTEPAASLAARASPDEGRAEAANRQKWSAVLRRVKLNPRLVNPTETIQRSLLYEAASAGQRAVAEQLLALGADLEARYNGRTALVHAAARHNLRAARVLLELGADVNAQGRNGVSALHCAVPLQRDLVKLLLQYGADVRIKDSNGETPILRASHWRDVVVIQLLLEDGADANARGLRQQTPLHLAAGSHQGGVAAVLIANGANVNAFDESRSTPLHKAVGKGGEDCVRLLLANGANVNAKDRLGKTPLHAAALHDLGPIVEYLIAAGADVSARDQYYSTPLHQAAFTKGIEAIGVLVAHGADADALDAFDQTPMHKAASQGRSDCVRLLLQSGARPNPRDVRGRTPQDLATEGGHTEVSQMFQDAASGLEADAPGNRPEGARRGP